MKKDGERIEDRGRNRKKDEERREERWNKLGLRCAKLRQSSASQIG